MNDLSLAELKSHTSAHQFVIYLGPEDYDEMAKQLQNVLPVIDKFSRHKVCIIMSIDDYCY